MTFSRSHVPTLALVSPIDQDFSQNLSRLELIQQILDQCTPVERLQVSAIASLSAGEGFSEIKADCRKPKKFKEKLSTLGLLPRDVSKYEKIHEKFKGFKHLLWGLGASAIFTLSAPRMEPVCQRIMDDNEPVDQKAVEALKKELVPAPQKKAKLNGTKWASSPGGGNGNLVIAAQIPDSKSARWFNKKVEENNGQMYLVFEEMRQNEYDLQELKAAMSEGNAETKEERVSGEPVAQPVLEPVQLPENMIVDGEFSLHSSTELTESVSADKAIAPLTENAICDSVENVISDNAIALSTENVTYGSVDGAIPDTATVELPESVSFDSVNGAFPGSVTMELSPNVTFDSVDSAISDNAIAPLIKTVTFEPVDGVVSDSATVELTENVTFDSADGAIPDNVTVQLTENVTDDGVESVIPNSVSLELSPNVICDSVNDVILDSAIAPLAEVEERKPPAIMPPPVQPQLNLLGIKVVPGNENKRAVDGWEVGQSAILNIRGLTIPNLVEWAEGSLLKVVEVIGKLGTIQNLKLSRSKDGATYSKLCQGNWISDDMDLDSRIENTVANARSPFEPYTAIIKLAKGLKTLRNKNQQEGKTYKQNFLTLRTTAAANSIWFDDQLLENESILNFVPGGKDFTVHQIAIPAPVVVAQPVPIVVPQKTEAEIVDEIRSLIEKPSTESWIKIASLADKDNKKLALLCSFLSESDKEDLIVCLATYIKEQPQAICEHDLDWLHPASLGKALKMLTFQACDKYDVLFTDLTFDTIEYYKQKSEVWVFVSESGEIVECDRSGFDVVK
jgi:hypothetical protein